MSNWQWSSIGLDNGLAPNRRQAIIWTNADPVHLRIHAAQGRDELIHSATYYMVLSLALRQLYDSIRCQESYSDDIIKSTSAKPRHTTINHNKEGTVCIILGVCFLSTHMMTSLNGNIFRGAGFCAENSPATGESPAQRLVTRGFGVSFDLRLE